MKRFALNFICKNESHVILRMLESVRSFTDLIVAVDTGSTDNTIALIKGFGEKYRIPTYVFERPFDDFGRSRNFALDKLRSTVRDLKWDLAATWGFRMDCDEVAEVSGRFERGRVEGDLCSVPLHFSGYANNRTTSRDLFFRLGKDFAWDGPVHEELEYDRESVLSVDLGELRIVREAVGASWKGDQEKKYLKWLGWVREYIESGNRDFKWVYFLGSTYCDAADHCKDEERKRQYLLEAHRWLEAAVGVDTRSRHERYKAHHTLAEIKERLEMEPSEIREMYLKAYSIDKRHAEPLAGIIFNGIRARQWNGAYLFSRFAVAHHHGNKPTGSDIENVDGSIYRWRLLLYHCTACVYSGRIVEGRAAIRQLRAVVKERQLTLPDQLLIKGSLLRLRVVAGLRWLRLRRGTPLFAA
jgi:glycosyltransferase involved in cell wall biosynthesis